MWFAPRWGLSHEAEVLMTSQSHTMATTIQRKRWVQFGRACIVASPVRGGVNVTIDGAWWRSLPRARQVAANP
jgi:hypothetical protein